MQRSLSSRQAAASMRSLLPASASASALALHTDASGFYHPERSKIRSADAVLSSGVRVGPNGGRGDSDLLLELKKRPALGHGHGPWVSAVQNPEVVQRGLEDSAQLSARQVRLQYYS